MTVGVVGLEQERIGFDDLRQIQYDPELATGTCARSYPGNKTARRGKSGRQREVRIGQIDDKPVGGLERKNPVRRGRGEIDYDPRRFGTRPDAQSLKFGAVRAE